MKISVQNHSYNFSETTFIGYESYKLFLLLTIVARFLHISDLEAHFWSTIFAQISGFLVISNSESKVPTVSDKICVPHWLFFVVD